MGRSKRASTVNASKASSSASKPAKRARTDSNGEDDHVKDFGVTRAQFDRLSEALAAKVGDRVGDDLGNKVLDSLKAAGVIPQPQSNSEGDGTQGVAAQGVTPVSQSEKVADETVNALVLGESPHCPTKSITSSFIPLGFHVTEKVRAKIIENQFVDFKYLLPGQRDEPLSLKLNHPNGDASLQLASNSTVKPITTIDKWNTAFANFCFIYQQAHPEAALSLIKFGEDVRLINRFFGFQAASAYDESYRQLKQLQPSLDLGETHTELSNRATTLYGFRPNNSPQAHDRPSPRGFCFTYNTHGVFCGKKPCPYRHKCQNCQGPHPKYSCPGAHNAGDRHNRTSDRSVIRPNNKPTPSSTHPNKR